MSKEKLTRKEFMDKYGEVEVRFRSYYKFTFYFNAELEDGATLSVGVGGSADEIYREEVAADTAGKVAGLFPYCGSVYKDGERVEGFYDYQALRNKGNT